MRNFLNLKKGAISVGRVMTCVLGMIVRREREIRAFEKTPFYRVIGTAQIQTVKEDGTVAHSVFEAEWKAVEGSKYYGSPLLYKENGFKKETDAKLLIGELMTPVGEDYPAQLEKKEKKTEKKNPPLLFNLAELQNQCAKLFKISPDETLGIVQDLYEKKLVTYPRTDARVLSTAVAKEIHKNISGLVQYDQVAPFASLIMKQQAYKGLAKSRYVNDKQITDHYAIIPTGQGLSALPGLPALSQKVYEVIARRFISIFYPPAEYEKYALILNRNQERLFANFKVLSSEGYLKVMSYSFMKKSLAQASAEKSNEESDQKVDAEVLDAIRNLKKGQNVPFTGFVIKEGETSPPKRYNSGSLILAMENAGQLIEDEELRAHIKGSGIGTSATRAEIIKKLVHIKYLNLNKKTQIITPTQLGEMVHDVVYCSIRSLLAPNLTASWEKGLTLVADGSVSEDEYMEKLTTFVTRMTNDVKNSRQQAVLNRQFAYIAQFYPEKR